MKFGDIFSVGYSEVVIEYNVLKRVTINGFWELCIQWSGPICADSHSEYEHRWPFGHLEPHPKSMVVNRNLWTDIHGCWTKHPANRQRGKANLPRAQILPSHLKQLSLQTLSFKV